MLGATQSVDMISCLRHEYGRVQVSVLDVSLLPNTIESVIIGDRLYTLPIEAGGDNDAAQENFMELDNDNTDVGEGSAKRDHGEKADGESEKKKR